MKKIFLIIALSLMTLTTLSAQSGVTRKSNGSFAYPVTLISDKTTDGVREIVVKNNPQVCSKQLNVRIKKDVILSVKFTGGCPGNTQGVERLCTGMKVKDAIDKLQDIDCSGRGTSCPDQLVQALMFAL